MKKKRTATTRQAPRPVKRKAAKSAGIRRAARDELIPEKGEDSNCHNDEGKKPGLKPEEKKMVEEKKNADVGLEGTAVACEPQQDVSHAKKENIPKTVIRPEHIPERLRELPQWVSMQIKWSEQNSKFEKIPLKSGRKKCASSTDPTTWDDFAFAFNTLRANQTLAFAMTEEAGIVCIDIDHCITDAGLNSEAQAIVDMFDGTYIEKSISGDGLHIFTSGTTAMNGNEKIEINNSEIEIEVYKTARFIAMTGNLIGTSISIENGSEALRALEGMRPRPERIRKRSALRTPPQSEKPQPSAVELAEALGFIDSTPYMNWLKVGFALKRWGDETGNPDEAWQIFDQWSQGTTKANYDADRNIDIWDEWILDGHDNPITIGTVFHLAKQNGYVSKKSKRPKDQIELPSAEYPIIDSAREIFSKLAETEQYFWRGERVQEISDDRFELVRPEAFRSRIEELGTTVAKVAMQNGGSALMPTRPSEQICKALLATKEAALLPHVDIVANAPMIFRGKDGRLLHGNGGYVGGAKAYILGSHTPVSIPANDAAAKLENLYRDFHFVSAGDKARALAFPISAALRLGGFIRYQRCPLFAIEADQSQTGKGTMIEMVTSIFNERPSLLAERDGGVGGFDESMQQKLIDGRPFISLDNLRGRVASAYLEMILTSPSAVGCRVPYRGEVLVDPHRFIFCATSNGMTSTRDLANRSVIIRLRKQRKGYEFYPWSEGGLIEHVQDNWELYLACVHSIIGAWHAAGSPTKQVTGHDFRGWHRMIEGIVEMAWPHLGAVIDPRHQEAVVRISDPAQSWLREFCQIAEMEQAISATEIAQICALNGLAIPSCRIDADESQQARSVGIQLNRLFGEEDSVEIENVRVSRQIERVRRSDGEGYMPLKVYRFERC